jgi:hypothetical protein
MNANDLLDLLLDGEYIGWRITRTPDGLEVVGITSSGQYRLLTVIQTEPSTIDQDTTQVG